MATAAARDEGDDGVSAVESDCNGHAGHTAAIQIGRGRGPFLS